MKKSIILFLLSLLLFGCSRSFQVLKYEDKFNPGWKTIYTTPIEVKNGSFFDLTSLNMQFAYNYSDTSSYYSVAFTFLGKGWIFVESAKILIDGNVFDLKPNSAANRDVIYADLVREIIGFNLPDKIIDLIAKSKNIEFRVGGSKRNIDFIFDEKIKTDFSKFLSEVTELKNAKQIKSTYEKK